MHEQFKDILPKIKYSINIVLCSTLLNTLLIQLLMTAINNIPLVKTRRIKGNLNNTMVLLEK